MLVTFLFFFLLIYLLSKCCISAVIVSPRHQGEIGILVWHLHYSVEIENLGSFYKGHDLARQTSFELDKVQWQQLYFLYTFKWFNNIGYQFKCELGLDGYLL